MDKQSYNMNRGRGSRPTTRGGRGSSRARGDTAERTRTNLPAKLLDELNAGEADQQDARRFNKFRNHALSRKKQRKAEREMKKKVADDYHRNAHKGQQAASAKGGRQGLQSSATGKGEGSRVAQQSHKRTVDRTTAAVLRPTKRRKVDESTSGPDVDAQRIAKFAEKNPALYSRLRRDNLVSAVPVTAQQAREDEDEDERNMRRYAKLLGIKLDPKGSKPQKLPAAFKKDGLADIFADLGNFEIAEGDGDSADDGKGEGGVGEESSEDSEAFDEDDGSGSSAASEEFGDEQDASSSASEQDSVEDEASDDSDGDSEESMTSFVDADGVNAHSDEGSEAGEASESKEGSEGPAPELSATGNGRYVPPHLRKVEAKQSESYLRLQRHLKGQLNRLTDSNMESIFKVAEESYRTNPRHNVTQVISDSILDYVVDTASLLESFVLTQATFVSLVHNIIGNDVASHIVESAVRRFLAAYENAKGADDEEQRDKVCLNLATFVAYLYDVKVVACVLVYDFVRLFIASLGLLDIELLLRILKISGYHLRADDPAALKEIVLQVQAKVKNMEKGPNSFRLDFMIETIIDLKNNKKKLSGATQNEELERLRKFVQNMIKRRLATGAEPLGFGLQDVRDADRKGRWWVTGAAWVGRDSETVDPSSAAYQPAANAALLELARKMNMNTDVRRNIFVVLMSSEDYADAVEGLLKLKLKDKQDREIARVIVLCAAQERAHNSYYELVAARFCNLSHGHKITFQYVLWDELKAVDDAEVRRISNVARFYGHLLSVRSLSISVLKAVAFESLSPKQLLFMRILFHAVFTHRLPASLDVGGYLGGVFGSLPPNPDFDALKVGIGVFLAKYMLAEDGNDAVVKASERKEVEAKVKKARKILRGKE